MEKLSFKLQKEVAEVYDVVNIKFPIFIDPRFGRINLPSLTISEANRLYKMGFSYLALKPKKSNSKDE